MSSLSRLFDQDWNNLDSFGRVGSELDKFLAAFESPRSSDTRTPHLNISQSEDEIQVSVELPGVSPDDVNVSVQDRHLTISGSHGSVEQSDENDWLLRERRASTAFERSVKLPWAVESGKVRAEYKNGLLYITLPRAEQDKPRKIEISAS